MITTDVGFTPLQSCDVEPPIIAGSRNSVWVKTRTRNESEIREAARNKMMVCYGVEIEDITLYGDFGDEEK